MAYETLMKEIENKIITMILKEIKTGDATSATFLADKLAKQSIINNRVANILNSYIPKIKEAISTESALSVKTAFNGVISSLEKISSNPLEGKLTNSSFETIIEYYEKSLKSNFNTVYASLINSSNFSQTVMTYNVLANSGTMSADDAILKITKEYASSGLPVIVDKAGRKWNTYTYASQLIRTTNRKVVTDVQQKTFDDYDIDLVEISSHDGARPLCAPYQGKIYSRSGKSKKYPALSTTSMGQSGGLFGINCGHTMYPYIEGTKKTYSTYSKKKNDEVYKQSQQQRSLENSIRKAKQNLKLCKESGLSTTEAQKSVDNQNSRMKSFISSTGRKRYPNKERI